MKVIGLLAVSANGFISRNDDSVDWSEDHWRNYFEICGQVKNLIVGRRTYELMEEEKEFDKLDIDNCVVISKSPKPETTRKLIWTNSPSDAVLKLKEASVNAAILGGGTGLMTSFVKEKLLDELMLDVEPRVFSSGYSIFNDFGSDLNLKLLDTFKSGQNTVRLHYAVNTKEQND